jgi:two-component system nitrogen regulation sensor histidine kinase GlnL
MTRAGYLLLGLTGIVGALSGILAFAVLKIFAAARSAAKGGTPIRGEAAFMATAMEDALQALKSQELAMKARAEASERLSSEIIASMTSGLLVVTEDGLVRTLNPAGCRLLGLPEHTDVSARYRDLLANAAPLSNVVDECLQTMRPIVRRAVQMAKPADGATHLGITVSPVRDGTGQPHGAICLFTDLSDVAELEEQLRLKDSLARLGELTAGIAHEFRNGLATIHGYARLLELDRLPPEFRPYVQGIRDETEALGQVVTNFLNFAKPADLTLTPVDMRGIVERAADEIRSDATARGGEVTIVGRFGMVEGDEVLLRQAFSNLCRNALEACTDANVPPRIVLEGVEDAAQQVLRITVSDNGPGIRQGAAPRIFTPFFTTKARGTGLGLALVQKIIVTHNGRITATNAEQGGARFNVSLPLGTS